MRCPLLLVASSRPLSGKARSYVRSVLAPSFKTTTSDVLLTSGELAASWQVGELDILRHHNRRDKEQKAGPTEATRGRKSCPKTDALLDRRLRAGGNSSPGTFTCNFPALTAERVEKTASRSLLTAEPTGEWPEPANIFRFMYYFLQ